MNEEMLIVSIWRIRDDGAMFEQDSNFHTLDEALKRMKELRDLGYWQIKLEWTTLGTKS